MITRIKYKRVELEIIYQRVSGLNGCHVTFYMRKSSLLKSIVSGNESDTFSYVPVPSNPIELPNQPGPSRMFMLKKNAIAAANMYVKMFIPRSCAPQKALKRRIR